MKKSRHIGIYLGRHSGRGGGIGSYINSLLEEILTKPPSNGLEGVSITIFSPKNILTKEAKKRCFKLNEDRGSNFTFVELGEVTGRYFSSILDHFFIRKEMKKREINLLLSTSNIGILNCPCEQVVVVHDLFQIRKTYDSLFSKLKASYYSFLFEKVLNSNNTKAIVVDSIQTQKDVKENYPKVSAKTHLVELGIDKDFFEVREQLLKGELPKNSSLKLKSGYVFSIFSDNPRKNSQNAIHAWKQLSEEHKARGFVILAESESQIASIKPLFNSKELTYLHFLTWLDRKELVEVYLYASALLFPSIKEGFGYPAYEMLSLGGYAVTGELNFESLKSNRQSRCNPGSVDDISKKLEGVLSISSQDSLNEKIEVLRKDKNITPRTMSEVARETLALCL